MAIELSPESQKELLLKIRQGEEAPILTAVEIDQKAQETELARMKMIDEVRMKVTSGAILSSEEEKFLKDAEAGKVAPIAEVLTPEQEQQAELAKSIDAITVKLEKGEVLTEEEKAFSDKFMDTPVIEEKIYKVGGKEYKTSELAPKLAEEWGVPLTDIPANVLSKAIETYVVKLNKEEWSKAATVRDQKLAVNRRQVGETMLNLMNAQERIKTDLERVQTAIKKAEALAKKEFDLESIYTTDNRLDPMKQYELNKILEAREKLPELQEEYKSINERSVQTERDLVAQQFRDFQVAHPEYATSQDVAVLSRYIGTDQINIEDEVRIDEMVRIFRNAQAQRTTPDKEHQYNLEVGTLRVKPKVTSAEPDALKFSKVGQPDAAKLLAAMKKKREGLFLGVPGVARREKVSDDKKAVAAIRAASQGATTGGQNRNEELVKLGY